MRLLRILGLICCFEAAFSQTGGSTYSCFSEFESVVTAGCTRRVDIEGGYEQEALQEVVSMDFCASGPVYGRAKQGSFGKAKNYVASATMKSSDMGKFSTNYGYLGLAFNMIDGSNYDILYARPHADNFCWELGRVEDGKLFGREHGRCPVNLGREFSIGVKLEAGKGYIYIEGVEVKEFSPFYPAINKVATVLRNNMVAKMEVKGLQVCQEMNCVSRSADGETVITAPGGFYKEPGMSTCEACTCQLYGQIRCGCSTPEEQGITCPANQIAAVGQDCCARCVPPSSTCTASGDPHYRTLDNVYYDYMGSCTYCTLKTIDFEVRHKNRNGGHVSYVQYCQLLFDGDLYDMQGSLSVMPDTGARQGLVTPFTKYYNTEDYISCTSGTSCSIYIKDTKVLKVDCSSGYFSIWLHGYYYERTQCMCGTWDGNSGNDLVNREGVNVGAYGMAAAWRVANNDGCGAPPEPTDPCDTVSREERNWAEAYCSKYKQPPFKACTVDVTQYYENCLFDVCTDPNSDKDICDNAQAYASACAAAGQPVVGWRSSSFCPMECPATFVYTNCGPGCHKTCSDPAPNDCEDSCVEGCYCPSGTVLQDGQCIEASDCQCLFEGSFLENGATWDNSAQCKTCSCQDSGIIDCGPLACDACPEGHAPISQSGMCCPLCLADWAQETDAVIGLIEGEGPAVLQCVLHEDVLVAPDDITWTSSNGNVIDNDNKPDNFEFDGNNLRLTIDPVNLGDTNTYVAEIVYNGVVGQCRFELTVDAIPAIDYIDIDGESPRTVKAGECQTMSVQVMGDFDFGSDDFTWNHGVAGTPIDFGDDKYTLSNGGKTIEVCNAEDSDMGLYEACVTKDEITDCVQISLVVLAVCVTDEQEYTEGDDWMDGEFMSCTCSMQGEAVCECVEQEITCTETEELYYEEDCEAACSRAPATCQVSGDPHYKTFDGLRHDFQGGSCRFSVVKTRDFEVVGTNNHRDDNMNVAWNDAVQIYFQELNIYLGPEGEVTVNGATTFLPYHKVFRNKKAVSIIQAGTSTVVSLDLGNNLEGLNLIWDGNSTVDATVHGKYYEDTKGLCGSWDDDTDNDMTNKKGKVDDNVNDFGWSWKYIEGDETCEEEPAPSHPCDDAIFPDAKPIADDACNILMEEPFSACHSLIAVDGPLYNCKYDTCSCFDSSCACHAVKSYVKECQEAGVATLGEWRERASFCPMDCPDNLSYDPCGSFCPPTCEDKEPDCGRLGDSCNEGCFCPAGQFLQDGACVAASQCRCMFKGEAKEVGVTWRDSDICKDCICQDEGEVVCLPIQCTKCNKNTLPVYQEEDVCCPVCIEEWLWTEQALHEDVAMHSELTIACVASVKPTTVDWHFSADEGETWQEIEAPNKLELTITGLTADNSGLYRCTAKKSYRKKEVVMRVSVGDAAQGCTATAPSNGAVDTAEVEIGGTVTYSCVEGFFLSGDETSTCGNDGSIGSVPECSAVVEVTFTTKSKVKKGKATLECSINDTSFNANSIPRFYLIDAAGNETLIPDQPAYSKKKKTVTYTFKKIKVKNSVSAKCEGNNESGDTHASATFTEF